MTDEKIIFHSHKPGDGLHYINDLVKILPDGTFQPGYTSEPCVILNIETILPHHDAGYLFSDLWNLAYPNQPMTDEDLGRMLLVAIDYTDAIDTSDPDTIRRAIEDLRAINLPELADLVTDVLEGCGIHL